MEDNTAGKAADREPHLVAFRDHALGEREPPLPRPAFADPSWAERALALRDDPRAMAVGLAAVALVAGVLFYRSALGTGGTAEAPPPGDPSVATAPTATTPKEVVVHVSGAVVSPGVYELGPGSRVTDAIEAAGGAAPGGEVDRLNLAALVGDGQRVHVPRVGEPMPDGAATGSEGDEATSGGLLDLNLATAEQLEGLPGVGPSLAEAIVTERAHRGAFRSVDDLLHVRGIGEKRLADLRPHVTV